MASSEYISREDAEKVFSQPVTMSMCLTLEECKMKNAQRQIDLFVIRGLPAADVRPRWIPVTERKPKTDGIVIVAIHDDSGDTPYDVTNVGFYLDVFPLGIWVVENERCNYVTHWMPLPEPPKEEEA